MVAGGLQCVKNRPVCIGKGIAVEFLRCNPSDLVAVDGACLAVGDRTAKEMQLDGLFRVLVTDDLDLYGVGDRNREFFAEFTLEAVLKRLVCFALPSRKFPQATEMDSRPSTSDKVSSFLEDNACRHSDDGPRTGWDRRAH